jgi:hypothetical protein
MHLVRIKEAQRAAIQAQPMVNITAQGEEFVGSKPGDDGNAAEKAEEVATMQGDGPWREIWEL